MSYWDMEMKMDMYVGRPAPDQWQQNFPSKLELGSTYSDAISGSAAA
jgi:hypothetical protein